MQMDHNKCVLSEEKLVACNIFMISKNSRPPSLLLVNPKY